MSEAGCHRPHVAGIHGREDEGAYSIVLSGGYEDDKVCMSVSVLKKPNILYKSYIHVFIYHNDLIKMGDRE